MAPPLPPQGQAALPRRSAEVRCVATFLLSLILITGLLLLFTWLVMINPNELEYSIEHGSINGYNLSNDGHLNATFNFVLRANNPYTRISLYYEKIDLTVSYEDQQLAAGNFHPFYQPRENVTHLELDLASKDAVVYGVVGRGLRMDKKSGDVDLDVKIRAKIRFEIGCFQRLRKFKVGCGPLTVPFSASKGFKRVLCDVDIDD